MADVHPVFNGELPGGDFADHLQRSCQCITLGINSPAQKISVSVARLSPTIYSSNISEQCDNFSEIHYYRDNYVNDEYVLRNILKTRCIYLPIDVKTDSNHLGE